MFQEYFLTILFPKNVFDCLLTDSISSSTFSLIRAENEISSTIIIPTKFLLSERDNSTQQWRYFSNGIAHYNLKKLICLFLYQFLTFLKGGRACH